jgi:hypothetical protein
VVVLLVVVLLAADPLEVGQSANRPWMARPHDRASCPGVRAWLVVIRSNASGDVNESSNDTTSAASAGVRLSISGAKQECNWSAIAARFRAMRSRHRSSSNARQRAKAISGLAWT